MRVFISIDIEGIAGVASTTHTVPGELGYKDGCRWMTAEARAACEGARAAGATSILIADSHGPGTNLILDALPEDVEVVSSWPRPMSMMQGVNEGFDVALLMGYHTGAHHAEGAFAHTFHGRQISKVSLNGEAATELTVSAAIAGQFGVPIALVTGDEATCQQGKDIIGDSLTVAAVKSDYGRESIRSLMPAAAQNFVREQTKIALTSPLPDLYTVKGPVQIDVQFKHHWTAEVLSYLPMMTRTDAYTVRYKCRDMAEAAGVFHFITSYTPTPKFT